MININKNLFLQQAENITAITSGVGSMGKTCIALTLAHAVNLLRRSVLFFDADNGLLNSAAQAGIQPEFSLDDVISGKKTLNQVIFSLNSKKFDIICGLPGSNTMEYAPDGQLQILREELVIIAQNYQNVFIDVPSDEKIVNNLPQINRLILVCSNDQSNLVSTYRFLQNKAYERFFDIQIIVNHANSYEEGMQTYTTLRRACEEYLKIVPELLGVIRHDTRVRESIRNQTMLLNCFPHSEAAEDIMQIAAKLLDKGAKNAK